MKDLWRYHNNFLKTVSDSFYRYSYHKVNWQTRMMGVKGPRGAGKTTMIAQYMKFGLPQDATALYISADHPYFYNHTLLEVAEDFYQEGGQHLFIDEVHKYEHWSGELKTIYDSLPDLQIIFSASSALDILKGEADLSRRALVYELPGLSFREYLNLVHDFAIEPLDLEGILKNHLSLAREIHSSFHPLPYFKEYLSTGYLPIILEHNKEDYLLKLNQVINTAIDTDLAYIEGYGAGSARKVKQLLGALAESVPFKPNISSLSKRIGVSRDYIYAYLNHLEKARILNFLMASGKGVSPLQKPDKLYLENTNFANALKEAPDNGNIRETFLLNQLKNTNRNVTLPKKGDFFIDDKWTIEVGGKNKKGLQVQGIENAFIAADNMEVGYGNKVPLWLFGLMY